jgi:mRNA-degrading endonuclease toxin of MazEF toxin-antitoxin module
LDFLRSKDANPDDTLGRTKLGRPIGRLEKKRMEERKKKIGKLRDSNGFDMSKA